MLTLRDRLRSRNVGRWHTVLTNIPQNIAEHSHGMGIIAEHILLKLMNQAEKTATMTDRFVVIKYAQVHDLPEIVTGDPSSVFKRFLRSNLSGFDGLMDELESHLVPELKDLELEFEARPYLSVICKAADLLEAFSYFLVAKGADEQHNKVVIGKLTDYIEECITKGEAVAPEYDWVLLRAVKDEIESGSSTVIDFETELEAVMNNRN
jgi:5'-deoxynucleotidase YfbR-like HD superfamily hydrolase